MGVSAAESEEPEWQSPSTWAARRSGREPQLPEPGIVAGSRQAHGAAPH